jgi:hypothetical protein
MPHEERFARLVDRARALPGWEASRESSRKGTTELTVEFARLGRQLGAAAVLLADADQAAVFGAPIEGPFPTWAADELGRVSLLADAATRLPPEALGALLDDLYAHGDNRERQAVLRSLAIVDGEGRWTRLGIEACRSHVQPVFEAIAAENPYPARAFPDLHFHQLVLKALFVGVPLERIWGLGRRRTAELARMAQDYAAERRAAGRPVPADIDKFLLFEKGPSEDPFDSPRRPPG